MRLRGPNVCQREPLGSSFCRAAPRISLRRPAHGELHDQNGNADRQQEADIDEHEQRAAVGSCDIGETPDVPESDGAARGEKKKTDAAAELFSLLVLTHAFLNPLCPAGTSVFHVSLVYGNRPHLAAVTTEGGGRNAPVGRNNVAPPLLQKSENQEKGRTVQIRAFQNAFLDAFVWALLVLVVSQSNGKPWGRGMGLFDKYSRLWKRETRPPQAGSGEGEFP